MVYTEQDRESERQREAEEKKEGEQAGSDLAPEALTPVTTNLWTAINSPHFTHEKTKLTLSHSIFS